jgi:hypothetical protein
VPTEKSCYKSSAPKGQCDAARIPVTDFRVQIPGPSPAAVHLIAVTGEKGPATTAAPIAGKGWAGVRVSGVRDAVVVWQTPDAPRGILAYNAPAGTHVIFDEAADTVDVVAKPEGKGCAVRVTPGGKLPARPLVVSLDASCAVTLDSEAPAASAIGTRAPRTGARTGGARSPRSGCCGAEAAPGSSIGAAAFVLLALFRRRRCS